MSEHRPTGNSNLSVWALDRFNFYSCSCPKETRPNEEQEKQGVGKVFALKQ
jgi:hypothetical protein